MPLPGMTPGRLPRYARRRSGSRPRFCPAGHDTFTVGRYSDGSCQECRREQTRRWQEQNPARAVATKRRFNKSAKGKAVTRRRRVRLKREALIHYGRSVADWTERRCARCNDGAFDPMLLQLDHVNGDGDAHRRRMLGSHRAAGSAYLAYLLKHGWPDSPPMQWLCPNCHAAKHWTLA